jgi:hypothetical protein
VNFCAGTKDHQPSHTPILAVKTPKGLAASAVDEEEVSELHLTMVQIGEDGERKVLAQHAVPLYNNYRISGEQIML